MRAARSALMAILAALAVSALAPAGAGAAFGFLPGTEGFDAAVTELDGSPATQAGSHPYELRAHLALRKAGQRSDGDLRDLDLTLPPSLFANPAASPKCDSAQFNTPRVSPFQASLSGESCPDNTQVGVATVHSSLAGGMTRSFGVFELEPPYGAAAAIGFSPFGAGVVLTAALRGGDAAMVFELDNFPQRLGIDVLELTLWGTPAAQPGPSGWDFSHDNERGNCLNEVDPSAHFGEPAFYEEVPPYPPAFIYRAGTCSVGGDPLENTPKSYLSLPSECGKPLPWELGASSWQQPARVEAEAQSDDAKGDPVLLEGCVEPLSKAKAQLRTELGATATGLVFNIDVDDGGGLLNPRGLVRSQVQSALVSLPEGLTINPSLGAGLGTCSEAEFARESASSVPGAGCPNASKIGEVAIEGLLDLAEPVKGSVFLAQPYANPTNSLLALYITAASSRRGLFTKAIGTVEPDPRTGRLLASFDGLPKLHYTHFTLSLREGQRAPLISPPACGAYTTALSLRPYSDPALVIEDSSPLLITKGEGGGPCPGGAARPFAPGLVAGSLNSQAGAYTPFDLRMARTDAEQEISSYSAAFPPGLLGKIATIPYCPEAAIAAAKARSGREELERPSCPAASEIGHTMAGYGVGPILAYAPGALYLAGPYNGAPLSVVAIDSALVGPFDLGTVVIRSAIRIDPRSAQAAIDSAGSDPIPHIVEGIPLHLRDIRVHVDRPGFTLNPTSCDPLATVSRLTGAGNDPFSGADDGAAISADRYQAFNCSALGFKPKLALALEGATKHGGYPSLRATYVPRAGDANLESAAVTLPRSLFLAQEHIGSVCTRPQFARGACPASSVYGWAKAVTPLLGEPLEGPVYLRTSTNPLPDLAASLRSANGIAVEVVGRIDSHRGGIRARFEALPDAPVSRFTMTLEGGRRGLLVNERSMCGSPRLTSARLAAHNNLGVAQKPRLGARCAKHRKRPHRKGGAKR